MAKAPSDKVFDKFGLPLMEEALKLMLVAAFAFQNHELSPSHALTVGFVWAASKLVANLVTFSPVHYEETYGKFARNYALFVAHSERRAYDAVAKVSVTSAASGDSGVTLVSEGETLPLKPVFNLDSFKSTPLSHSVLVPIAAKDPQSHLTIDRVYAVSPKNTMHLEHFGDDDFDVASFNPHGSHERSESSGESFHTTDTHFGGGGGGGTQIKLPNGGTIDFGGGLGFGYDHTSPCRSRESLISSEPEQCSPAPLKLQLCLRWLSWLLPIKNENKEISQSDLRQSIRKKLSTYTLNSQTLSLKPRTCRSLYGTIDLESQMEVPRRRIENGHRFYRFGSFANAYLDSWSSAISLDPAFIRFGVTLPKLPHALFLAYLSSACFWLFSSALLYALPFSQSPLMSTLSGGAVLLVVFKLFCGNYLHSQCTRSYRFSVLMELVLNVSLLSLVYYLYII